MKQLLTILFAVTLFACSKDDDPNPIVTQDYTSFTVACETSSQTIRSCVAGYKGDDGIWVRVASLGDIVGKTESNEVKVDYSKVKEIYLFYDGYENGVYKKTVMIDLKYLLQEKKKNVFIVPYPIPIIDASKDNPNEYPQP